MSNILEPHTGRETFIGENEILKAIDKDTWKHSWHLKSDWKFDVQTLQELDRVLLKKIHEREQDIREFIGARGRIEMRIRNLNT